MALLALAERDRLGLLKGGGGREARMFLGDRWPTLEVGPRSS